MNRIHGHIKTIHPEDGFLHVIVTTGAREFNVLMLEPAPAGVKNGQPVQLSFKNSSLFLSKGAENLDLGIDNHFEGEVRAVQPGKVIWRVNVHWEGGTVCAWVPAARAAELNFEMGQQVLCWIPSTEIGLEPGGGPG